MNLITNTKVGKESSRPIPTIVLDGMVTTTKMDTVPRVISGMVLQTAPKPGKKDVVTKSTHPVPKTMPKGFGQVPYAGKMY